MANIPVRLEDKWRTVQSRFSAGDLAGALATLLSLAEQGEGLAYVEIGNIYELGGKSVSRDFNEALRWYGRAVKETDDPNAHLGIGRILYNLPGVERDDERALHHLVKAGGHPAALMLRGLMHQLGRGTAIDLEKARSFYEQAARAGYLMPLTLLGRLEEAEGRYWRGLFLRLKAGVIGFKIARKNPKDPRLTGAALSKTRRTQ
jgi:TPR repeat protein